ncbi:hypothetical protein FQR65_LT16660 [Abscondita terminalis]|nr:hypothetical protein FQR65_LT16660 [Abscondita terminalis]
MMVNGKVKKRVSLDKVINWQGRKLVEFCEEIGWMVLNENMAEVKKGERMEDMENFIIGESEDSDRQPLEVTLVGEEEKDIEEEREECMEKSVWTKESMGDKTKLRRRHRERDKQHSGANGGSNTEK